MARSIQMTFIRTKGMINQAGPKWSHFLFILCSQFSFNAGFILTNDADDRKLWRINNVSHFQNWWIIPVVLKPLFSHLGRNIHLGDWCQFYGRNGKFRRCCIKVAIIKGWKRYSLNLWLIFFCVGVKLNKYLFFVFRSCRNSQLIQLLQPDSQYLLKRLRGETEILAFWSQWIGRPWWIGRDLADKNEAQRKEVRFSGYWPRN